MANDNEMVAEILKELRGIKGGQHTNGGLSYERWRARCQFADDYADRIESAHKREIAAKDERYLKCREELAATRERRDECEVKMRKAFERVTKAEQKLAAKDSERLTIVANYETVIAAKDAEIAELRRRLKVAEDALELCISGMCGECHRQNPEGTCVCPNGCYEMAIAKNAIAAIRGEGGQDGK